MTPTERMSQGRPTRLQQEARGESVTEPTGGRGAQKGSPGGVARQGCVGDLVWGSQG